MRPARRWSTRSTAAPRVSRPRVESAKSPRRGPIRTVRRRLRRLQPGEQRLQAGLVLLQILPQAVPLGVDDLGAQLGQMIRDDTTQESDVLGTQAQFHHFLPPAWHSTAAAVRYLRRGPAAPIGTTLDPFFAG